MNPQTIALILGSLGLTGKIGGGLLAGSVGRKQQDEGLRMIEAAEQLRGEHTRPEMMVPDAIRQMVDLSHGQMYQRMPGATHYEGQIQGATAAGLSAIKGMSAGAEGIGAVADLFGGQMGAMRDLAIGDASFRQQGQQNYLNALQGLGQWEQQAWQWNEADPYMMAMQRASQLEQFGRMNQFQGFKNRAGVWGETLKGVGDMFGGGDNFSQMLMQVLSGAA